MSIFCTLFDSTYLTRGLALYESLRKHCHSFHLYVFPFDDLACDILLKLNLPSLTVIPLSSLEDASLLAVKPTRTHQEYCWTCTPSTIRYVLQHCDADVCTYLDADVYFLASPDILLDELGSDSVIITAHNYAPEHDQTETSGKYCVQFITFRNDTNGLHILNWWREQCLHWCFARFEDGKFGDQKYLDHWTTQFRGVHELQHLGGGVAPWNVSQFSLFSENGRCHARLHSSQSVFQVVFYHFHSLRFDVNNNIDSRYAGVQYPLSSQDINLLYKPYLRHLKAISRSVHKRDRRIKPIGIIDPQIMRLRQLPLQYYEYLNKGLDRAIRWCGFSR